MMPDPLGAAPALAAFDALHARGAHFVLAGKPEATKPKGAFGEDWPNKPASLASAKARFRQGRFVGVIPASLGCIVVDIDHGGEATRDATLATLGTPVAVLPSGRPDHWHLWYKCRDAAKVGIPTWDGGDLRGNSKGMIILYHPADVAAGLAMADTKPVADLILADVQQLPGMGGKRANVVPLHGQGRNNDLNREAFEAVINGDKAGVQRAIEKARTAGLGEAEIAKTVKSATGGAERELEKGGAERTLIPNAYTPEGLATVLKVIGADLRMNTRANAYEFNFGDGWRQIDDPAEAALRRGTIPAACKVRDRDKVKPLVYGREMLTDLRLALVNERRVDSFLVYIEGLPEWDGEPRVENLLRDMFGAGDDELARWASRYIGLGALQRAYEPGCALQEFPVLIGPQGCGKSAFTQCWFDPTRPEQKAWHGDSLDLSARAQEKAEAMSGRVVVELAELAGLRRAEIESLKKFITQVDDGQVRLAYARTATPTPRRCIFVATSNDDAVLPNDASGNRRFVPIELRHGCDVWARAEARAQWWAECLYRYRHGERAGLPRELHADAAERAEQHRAQDALENEIPDALHDLDASGFTVNDLHQILNGPGARPPTTAEAMRLASALKNSGFSKRRAMRGGVQAVLWSR